MITETEFFTRVRHFTTGGPETVRDANNQILALAAELTIARDRRNRETLRQILLNGPAASDLVRSKNSNGRDVE